MSVSLASQLQQFVKQPFHKPRRSLDDTVSLIVEFIKNNPGCNKKEVARYAGVDPSSIGNYSKLLETKGVVITKSYPATYDFNAALVEEVE